MSDCLESLFSEVFSKIAPASNAERATPPFALGAVGRGIASLVLVCLVVVLAAPLAHSAEPGAQETFTRIGGNVALLNDIPGRNMIPNEFGYGAELGHRWEHWGVFGQLTHNLWAPNRQGWTIKPGVINAGVGVEYMLFDRRVRISAAAGSSTLLFETLLDEAGTTGFFFELRPVGLRWELTESLRVEWDPILFSRTQPVMDEPTLDQTEFKSVLTFEVGL